MSTKLAPTKITDSDKTKMSHENGCRKGTASMKPNVDITTFYKSAKINHVIKDAKTDISKHAGMAQSVKE